jgi:hypothetical protein
MVKHMALGLLVNLPEGTGINAKQLMSKGSNLEVSDFTGYKAKEGQRGLQTTLFHD